LGDAVPVRAYDVVSQGSLSVSVGSGNQATVGGINRTRYPDDTVVAIVLDRPVVPADIAKGCPTSSDSVESAKGNYAANAVDGDTSTRWCAANGSTGHTLTVDLGSVRTVTGARIAWEFAGRRYGYHVDGSTDGSTWTTLSDRTTTTSTSQVQTVGFATHTRYLRLTVTALESGCWASVRSFEVYDRPFLDPSLSLT
jgi:alpha-L-fucosidase